MSAPAIQLVPLSRHHLAQTLVWNNDAENMRLLNRERPIEETEHQTWFAGLSGRNDCRYFAIEEKGKHVGNVWLWEIDPRHHRAEVRIVIGARENCSRGVGAEALRQIGDYARESLQLRRLIACVLGINPRARRAFENAGFLLEGTLRQDRWSGGCYVDTWLMGKLL